MSLEAGIPGVNQNPLAYTGVPTAVVPCGWFPRAPNTSDVNYPYMFVWGNIDDGSMWIRTNSAIVWIEINSGSGHQDVDDGGTGRDTLTNHSVLIGAGTNPINFSGPGGAGTVLQGAGASADPAFSTATYPASTAQGDLLLSAATNTISALSKNTSATRYLANTGSSNNAQWDLVNLSNGVTGVLDVEHGGSGSAGVTGTVQTTDNTPTTVISFPCGSTPGTYTFDVRIAGFASAGAGTPLGVGYTIVGSVRTDGATTATFINKIVDSFEEGAMSGCIGSLTASGNNAIVQVTGVSAYTITWKSDLIYTFTGA